MSMIGHFSKLAGKTVFVSGASRGIGLAIALRCARDGAKVVIAAKTAETHPTLPGTIYTAAQEIEKAGGKALPCIVDVRNEKQVEKAVLAAVDRFGGIDIVVNNASAISATNTMDTTMKKFDLMHQINLRGSYLCAKLCYPYLKDGHNPHILNISPPINMNPLWLKNYSAYTVAKYGMTMFAMGMAEEFKEDGIAVNTLWPTTAIWTSAVPQFLGPKEESKPHCRRPSIMADAAHIILMRDSKTFTGNSCIAEDILAEEGITDFTAYEYVKNPQLQPDMFLETDGPIEAPYEFPKVAIKQN